MLMRRTGHFDRLLADHRASKFMNGSLAVVAFAGLCLPVRAAHAEPMVLACPLVENIASATMKVRQAGVDMSLAMEAAAGEGLVVELARQMIHEAYEAPLHPTQRMRDQEITRFTQKWALACNSEEARAVQGDDRG